MPKTVPQIAASRQLDSTAALRSVTRRSVAAIRLLALTGARRGEMLKARWKQFNLRRQGFGVIRLYTNVLMTENIAFYSRLDYVETHRAEEKVYSRIYMEKRLLERSRPT